MPENKTPEQRALDIIASLDKDGRENLRKIFSKMTFKKDPTLKEKAKSYYDRINDASEE